MNEEQKAQARKIPKVLAVRYAGIDDSVELARRVYNEAIEDAANFLRDLAPKNPMQSSTLLAAEKEIREWLIIPE